MIKVKYKSKFNSKATKEEKKIIKEFFENWKRYLLSYNNIFIIKNGEWERIY